MNIKKPFTLSKKKSKFNGFTVFLFVVLSIYALVLIALLVWGLLSSFKTDLFFTKHSLFEWPNPFKFDNYINVFTKFTYAKTDFIEMLGNSIFYAVGCAVFATLIPCVTAYVCARFKFKFLKVYYVIVIVAMVIPIVGSLPSEIKMAQMFGLYGNLWGIWIMKANFLGLYFLIFYSTFKNLPETYNEAAKIDGANNWNIMVKVMMPLARNTFVTVFLLQFINFWNDYQTPLIYAGTHPTLSFGVYLVLQYGGPTCGLLSGPPSLMSLTVVALLPPLVLFLIFHKRLMSNLTVGGIK